MGDAGTTDRPPGTRSRGSRLTFLAGLSMLLVGVGLLGYVGWQLFGTTYVSQRAQDDLVEQLERDWSRPAPDPQDGGTLQAVASGDDGPAILRIPALGGEYAVPILDGVDEATLTEGLGHFPTSAAPGEVGNYALAGHRITHGEPFRRLPELRPGDRVIVETRETRYVYELLTDPNDLVVDFSQVWVVDPLPTNPSPGGVQPPQADDQRLITLTTCSELFHTDNRMIAFGELVRTVDKA
ncbi:class E sortase [Nocardioidaceae bacterium]|nr:class E sortase [Nocardioidaceae bacterium]